MHLEDLLDSEVALPSIPRTIAMVLSELDRDEPDLRVLNQHIHTDLGLTTRLLALANSAQYQLTQKIGTVSDALAILGLDQVRALTIAAALAGSFKTVPGLDLPTFWRYSLDVAKLARKLARTVRSHATLSYTAGLIHASGELVMHLGMPDQMRWLNERTDLLSPQRVKAQKHLLGYSYAEVGTALAQRWQFPQAMIDALAHQNAPFENDTYEPLAGVLHLCAWRARAQASELRETQLATTFPDAVAIALELDFDEVLQRDPIDWTTPQESMVMI